MCANITCAVLGPGGDRQRDARQVGVGAAVDVGGHVLRADVAAGAGRVGVAVVVADVEVLGQLGGLGGVVDAVARGERGAHARGAAGVGHPGLVDVEIRPGGDADTVEAVVVVLVGLLDVVFVGVHVEADVGPAVGGVGGHSERLVVGARLPGGKVVLDQGACEVGARRRAGAGAPVEVDVEVAVGHLAGVGVAHGVLGGERRAHVGGAARVARVGRGDGQVRGDVCDSDGVVVPVVALVALHYFVVVVQVGADVGVAVFGRGGDGQGDAGEVDVRAAVDVRGHELGPQGGAARGGLTGTVVIADVEVGGQLGGLGRVVDAVARGERRADGGGGAGVRHPRLVDVQIGPGGDVDRAEAVVVVLVGLLDVVLVRVGVDTHVPCAVQGVGGHGERLVVGAGLVLAEVVRHHGVANVGAGAAGGPGAIVKVDVEVGGEGVAPVAHGVGRGEARPGVRRGTAVVRLHIGDVQILGLGRVGGQKDREEDDSGDDRALKHANSPDLSFLEAPIEPRTGTLENCPVAQWWDTCDNLAP